MATDFPNYPATTFEQAVELAIFSSNQLHQVINSDAKSEVETENGDIPSIRKALIDNLYFKSPIAWSQGSSTTIFNQLYYFYQSGVVNGYYFAPTATTNNPIKLGTTPVEDDNWVLYSTISKQTPTDVYPFTYTPTKDTTTILVGRNFDTAILTVNGVVMIPNVDYTIENSDSFKLTSPIGIDPDTGEADILFAYIGKITQDSNTDYVTYPDLAKSTGASLIGTSSGRTIQQELNITTQNLGNYEDGRLTLINENQEIRRDGIKYYLASGVSLPYTTTGTTDATWEFDKNSFFAVGDEVLREDISSTDIGLGDSLIAVKQPYNGAVATTQHKKNAETLSVADFGIVGDGSDETSKWKTLLQNMGGYEFYVPEGKYLVSEEIGGNWDNLIILNLHPNAVLTPSRYFSGLLNVVSKSKDTSKFGSGVVSAGTTSNFGGFKVGGGAIMDSGDGMFLSSDGHANWMRIQTSKNYNPSEVVVYGSAGQGQLVHQSQNILVRESGSLFDLDNWRVGDAIYAFDRALVITELTSNNQISVTEIGGGNLSAAISTHSRFHYIYTTGDGVCSVVKGVCTRLSGDPFFFFGSGDTTYRFWLDGKIQKVNSISNNGNTCTLQDTSVNSPSSKYSMRMDINAQISTIRIQKTTGSDEENLTISAKATGEYEIRGGVSGSGNYYPIRFYNGTDGDYAPLKVAEISANGKFGVMNTGGGPIALFSVDNKTNTALSDGNKQTAMIVRSTYTDGGRELWIGHLGNNGNNGGFLQGSDRTGNNYQLSLNPRGANVGINTDNPQFPLDINGACGPHVDNTYTLGNSTRRWATVYATNGTIQTSDGALKDVIGVTEVEKAISKELPSLLCKFRWKSGGVINFGVVAQDVVALFSKYGLDALDYGIISKDADSEYYGVNYQQLYAMILIAKS